MLLDEPVIPLTSRLYVSPILDNLDYELVDAWNSYITTLEYSSNVLVYLIILRAVGFDSSRTSSIRELEEDFDINTALSRSAITRAYTIT